MRLNIVALFTNLVLAKIAFVNAAANPRELYNVVSPIDSKPFTDLPDLDSRGLTILLTDLDANKVFYNLAMTAAEAAVIANKLQDSGTVDIDYARQIDDSLQSDSIDEADQNTVNQTATVTTVNAASPSYYLTNIPNCQGRIENTEFIVMDTYLNDKLPELRGVKIEYGNITGNNISCNPHSSEVSSIILGNTRGVIRSGERKIFNIPVFACSGRTSDSVIIASINQAIERTKLNKQKGIRSILNFSVSGGGRSLAQDAAVAAAVKSGMIFGISAGNTVNNICDHVSPYNVPGIMVVGGTVKPGNDKIWFSDYGWCVKYYTPGAVTSFNKKVIQGTSFSIPQGVALSALEWSIDPKADPQTIINRVAARTVPVQSKYAGIIRVFLSNNTCTPALVPFLTTYTTSRANNNKFNTWYSGHSPYNNYLCISVSANMVSNNGGALIGLRSNPSDANPILIRFDAARSGKKYVQSIWQNGEQVASTVTNNRLIPTGKQKTQAVLISNQNDVLTIQAISPQGYNTLLSTNIPATKTQEISFSAVNNGVVKYASARLCGA